MKHIIIQDNDLQQLTVLVKMIAEGTYKVKGDSLLAAANSLRHLAGLIERVKHASPLPEPAQPTYVPPADPVPAPAKKAKR